MVYEAEQQSGSYRSDSFSGDTEPFNPDEVLAVDLYDTHINPDGSISRNRSIIPSAEAAAAMGQIIKKTLAERNKQTDALAIARMNRENPNT